MATRTVGRRKGKNADITSDDQLLLLSFVCLIIHLSLSHLATFLMHGAELELVRQFCPLLSFSFSFLLLKMLA